MLGVVLAAGLGERMKPLTLERPKALLPKMGATHLGWAFGRLKDAGVRRIWVNCHRFVEMIEREARSWSAKLGISIEISVEETQPLGTAGALRKISGSLDDTFLLLSADVMLDDQLPLLVRAHDSSGASATVLAVPAESGADFIVDEGWVGDLIDRRETISAGHMYGNAGVFEPDVLELVPPGISGIYETVFAGLIEGNKGIAALVHEGYWLNVTTPVDHLRANLDSLSKENGVRSFLHLDRPIRDDQLAFVGSGAEVGETVLRHTIVGNGAKLEPGCRLERCVVWNDAGVKRGDYRDSILTGTNVLTL